jgi:hypothetical protein
MESRAAMLTLLRQHYNWLVKVETVLQSFREFMLLPVCKISSATYTTSFDINHCGNYLPYVCMSICKREMHLLR